MKRSLGVLGQGQRQGCNKHGILVNSKKIKASKLASLCTTEWHTHQLCAPDALVGLERALVGRRVEIQLEVSAAVALHGAADLVASIAGLLLAPRSLQQQVRSAMRGVLQVQRLLVICWMPA